MTRFEKYTRTPKDLAKKLVTFNDEYFGWCAADGTVYDSGDTCKKDQKAYNKALDRTIEWLLEDIGNERSE